MSNWQMTSMLKFKHLSFITITTFFALFQYSTSQNTSGHVHVSKHGTNIDNCGSLIDPCGTLYYASTLLDHLNNITIIYVIDGQNETEIQLYIDNITYTENSTISNYTRYYHPCLPKKDLFISYKGDNIPIVDVPRYTYTIIFNEIHITTMHDWFPPICDDEFLINAVTKNNYIVEIDPYGTSQLANISELVNIKSNNYYTFFDTFSNDIPLVLYANFHNLIISDYYFKNFTLIEHGIDDALEFQEYVYGDLAFTCINCKFINITFECYSLIQASYLSLVNVTISNISISCNSSENLNPVMFDMSRTFDKGEIEFDNVHVYDVHMKTSFFKTEYNKIYLNNCEFKNVYNGYDIFGEQSGSNSQIQIINTDFSYIYPAVFMFNSEKTDYNIYQYITLINVNFIIDIAGTDKPVFRTDVSTFISFHNVSVYYEYIVSKYCIPPHVFVPIEGFVPSSCYNPQSFLQSNEGSELINMVFQIDLIGTNDYHQQVADAFEQNKDEFNISYSYFISNVGLISNVGDSNEMVISNVIFQPFAFCYSTIRTGKKITLNNVNIIHDDGYRPFNYNYLESEIFLYIQIPQTSVSADDILITHSDLRGVRNIMIAVHLSLRTFKITDSHIGDAMTLIAVVGKSGMTIDEIIIEHSHLENAYYSMISIHSVNNLIINSCQFTSYGRFEMIYAADQRYILMENNTFGYTDNSVLSQLETKHFMLNKPTGNIGEKLSFVLTAGFYGDLITEIEMISNDFGNNNNDIYPTLSLAISNICLSNNTFYNYAMQLSFANNVTSCYKKRMLEYCETNQCCKQYGEVNENLIDKTGYFILNDTSIQPITAVSRCILCGVNIALENIVFQVLDNRTHILLPFAAELLFTDVIIESINGDIEFSFIDSQCNILCNQLMNNNFITQIKIQCDYTPVSVTTFGYSLQWEGTELISHATPHTLVLNAVNNGHYFAGEFMKFKYFILDKFENIINFTNYNHSISITVSIINEQFSYFEQITIDKNGYCFFCDSGLYIPSITLQHIGQTFILHTEDSNNELIVSDIEIFVLSCPISYGIDAFDYHCIECPPDYFQLSNTTSYCTSCKNENQQNYGFKCNGGDSITVSHHYWVAVKGTTDIDISIFPTNVSIVTSPCPYLYCCEMINGCDYLSNNNNLCALNRDANSPLCGMCKNGFSESMNGSNCLKCDDQIIYFQWLLYPLCLAIVFTIYLIVSNSRNTNTSNRSRNKKEVFRNKRFELMVVLMMTKCIIYFEQSISQIIVSGSIIVNVSTVSALFDLSLTSLSNSNSNAGCFISGLDAKYKILCNIITTIMIVILVIFISLIMNNTNIICNGKRKLSVLKAFIKLLLLCTGQVLSIVFKLLSCQKVGNNYFVHFYFGNEQCYKSTWFISLFGLICIMAIFVILFIKLKRMDATQRAAQKDALSYVFTRAFKPTYFYWEFIILLRRIIVIIIAISFKSKFASLSLIIILLICVFLQYKHQPFIMNEINDMELMLLCCLICAISIQVALSAQEDYITAYILFIGLIMFPFILLIHYMVINIYKIKTGKIVNGNNSYNNVFSMKQRIKYLMLSIIVWYSSQYKHDNIRHNTSSSDEEMIELVQREFRKKATNELSFSTTL